MTSTTDGRTGHLTEHELALVLKRPVSKALVERLVWNVRFARRVASDRQKKIQERQESLELMDRKLPSDVYAEATVLGTLIIHPTLIDQQGLTPAHFMDEGHEQIFQAMLRLKQRGEPVDVSHLAEELRNGEQWQLGMDAGKLADAMWASGSPGRFQEYVARVEDQYHRRELFFAAVEVIKAVHSDRLTEEVHEWARREFV